MQAITQEYYTLEEYLQIEESAAYKSEYIDGLIIPMAGATTNHNRITGNLYAALNFAFKQQPYEAFITDVRLWIPAKNTFTYPDIMIVAGEPEYLENRTDTLLNPLVIVEILSKSTENYDRSNKFTDYRTIPTFQEYILVDQNRVYAQQFSKVDRKNWTLKEYDLEDEYLTLNSVNFQVALADIYNKVKLDVTETHNEG